MNENSLLSVM